jgi:hypothetical protein
MLALWAEKNVVVAEEFCDGNVPALKDPLRKSGSLTAKTEKRWRNARRWTTIRKRRRRIATGSRACEPRMLQ